MVSLQTRREEAFAEHLPKSIRIRRGNAEDEPATFAITQRAMGFDMSWTQHAAMRHHLRESPGSSFWVAEECPRFARPRTIGYTRSLVRDKVWALTCFYVLPEHQRHGVGKALLHRILDDSERFGADTRLILASLSPAADALYIRTAGCFPRLPMLLMAGPMDSLRVGISEANTIMDTLVPGIGAGLFGETATLLAEPMLLNAELLRELETLDRQIVGYARPTEHAQWTRAMGGAKGPSRLFRHFRNGVIGPLAGYSYIGGHSGGPAAATEPHLLPRFVAHTAALLNNRPRGNFEPGFFAPTDHYCAISGTNETMLSWLLSCGWRIGFQYVLMTSRPFGQFDRYVCHNPLYVL